MTVYWLEQAAADVPAGAGWLSAREAERLASFRFEKRRADWLLGRWTAKRAAAALLRLPVACLPAIEIRAAPSGAPEVFIDGERGPLAISLSHRGGVALCVVAHAPATLGCDVEVVEPRSEAFAQDYFTASERQSSVSIGDAALVLMWSAKESALKALKVGLTVDTRSVEVTLIERDGPPGEWARLGIRSGKCGFEGWWRRSDRWMTTVVASPACAPPIRIDHSGTLGRLPPFLALSPLRGP